MKTEAQGRPALATADSLHPQNVVVDLPTPPVTLEIPGDDDASALGAMHQASWQETYPSTAHGVDAPWISDHTAFMTTPAADEFRRGLLTAQRDDPESTFYRWRARAAQSPASSTPPAAL